MSKFKCGCDATFMARRALRLTEAHAASVNCSACQDAERAAKYATSFDVMMSDIKSGKDKATALAEFTRRNAA